MELLPEEMYDVIYIMSLPSRVLCVGQIGRITGN